MIRTGLHIVFVLVSFASIGQKLEANISSKQELIGVPITLTYIVLLEKTDSVLFQPEVDEIGVREITGQSTLSNTETNFEIREEFQDTFIIEDSKKRWIGEYVVAAWDSGLFLIQGPDIVINDSVHRFDNLKIACFLVDPVSGMDIYDIREGFADVPNPPFNLGRFLKKHWWWLTIILVLIIGYFIYQRRRNIEEPEEEIYTSLKDRTLIAIDALDSAKLWEVGKLKEHFIELSFILRSYLTARYSISLLEMTTTQSRLILRNQGLNDDTIEVIMRVLSQSDMVKFAKSSPETIEILKISTLVRQIVAETSPLEFDNVE